MAAENAKLEALLDVLCLQQHSLNSFRGDKVNARQSDEVAFRTNQTPKPNL